MAVMKYVVGVNSKGSEKIFLFPESVMHISIGHVLQRGFKEHPLMGAPWISFDIISAGFVNLDKLACYGKSESLKLESRPERDSQLLRTQL